MNARNGISNVRSDRLLWCYASHGGLVETGWECRVLQGDEPGVAKKLWRNCGDR